MKNQDQNELTDDQLEQASAAGIDGGNAYRLRFGLLGIKEDNETKR